ncbi:hypothetical protein [Saccharopolyspora endophytica]|uniref:Uncharacterized protein n=1 Tax=Saccharopolyspora endophytica TaxID=543886 RepID=A0ABS5DH05_9PSEU|nr:hypothetical protein [Saccharopolyspora endophytica]MBQ0925561.1 hypothetical protein [Saccharopolyspora endophytica]
MRDAGQGDLNPPQVYQWLTANFTNACGDTANLLRETTFPDSGAERSLDDLTEVVAELRRRGRGSPTSGSTAAVTPSSLSGAVTTAGSRRATSAVTPWPIRLGRARTRAQRPCPPRNSRTACSPSAITTSPTAARAVPASDIRDDGVNLLGEVVTKVRPENEQHGRVSAQLGGFADTWDEIRTSTLSPGEWMESRFG